jgi:hypothetical protein
MNKRQLFIWLKEQGCDISVREGVNNSAPPIIFKNSRNNTFSYFALPRHDDVVPRQSVEKIIKDLGIEPPKGF